jgi:hypothetical protein
MANQVYNNFKKLALSGAVNLFTSTVKVMLVSGAYTFSQNHTKTGDITAEITSAGYTKGGAAISSLSVGIDTINNRVYVSGQPVVFSGLTCSTNYGILYISGATAATSYLIGQIDYGAQTLTASNFTINWNSSGIYVD